MSERDAIPITRDNCDFFLDPCPETGGWLARRDAESPLFCLHGDTQEEAIEKAVRALRAYGKTHYLTPHRGGDDE